MSSLTNVQSLNNFGETINKKLSVQIKKLKVWKSYRNLKTPFYFEMGEIQIPKMTK